MRVAAFPGRAVRAGAISIVAVAIALLGIWAQNESLVGVNYDDGIYALVAKAVADGEGYVLPHLPQAIPAVKYPPVYPLSLVPFWKLVHSREAALGAMKLANGLYIGIAAGLFVWLLIELGILAPALATAVAFVGFASGSMMLVTSGLLTEPLYLVLLWAALLLADTIGDRPDHSRLVTAGVVVGLVVLTRMVGIALLGAVLIGVWRRCGRRAATVAAGAAAFTIAPWLLFTVLKAPGIPEVLVPRYGSYAQLYVASLAGDPFSALGIAITNVGAILQALGARVTPLPGPVLQSLVGALVIGLAMLGSRHVSKIAPATATYPWLYLLVISVWSFPPFRFVFILFPLLLALAVVGFLELGARVASVPSRLSQRWRRVGFQALGAALLMVMVQGQARALKRRVWDAAQMQKSAHSAEVLEWATSHAEPDAVIAFEFDPLLGLYADHTVVPNNYEPVHLWYRRAAPPVEPLARLLVEMEVDYLAVRPAVQAAAAPIDALMSHYPSSLELVHVTRSGVLVFSTDREQIAGPSSGRPLSTTK